MPASSTGAAARWIATSRPSSAYRTPGGKKWNTAPGAVGLQLCDDVLNLEEDFEAGGPGWPVCEAMRRMEIQDATQSSPPAADTFCETAGMSVLSGVGSLVAPAAAQEHWLSRLSPTSSKELSGRQAAAAWVRLARGQHLRRLLSSRAAGETEDDDVFLAPEGEFTTASTCRRDSDCHGACWACRCVSYNGTCAANCCAPCAFACRSGWTCLGCVLVGCPACMSLNRCCRRRECRWREACA